MGLTEGLWVLVMGHVSLFHRIPFFSCVPLLLSPNMNILADVSGQLEIHYRPRWGESRHASCYTDVHR